MIPKFPAPIWIASFVFLLFIVHILYNGAFERAPLHMPYSPSSKATPSIYRDQPEDFPRKIWQSWKDDSEKPSERTKGFPHQWREMHPDWRYELIRDSNSNAYVQDNFSHNISSLFTNMTDPVLRADYLRYLIIAKEGGLWADMDVRPIVPVDRWIPEEHKGRVNLVIGMENDKHKRPMWPGLPYSVQLVQYVFLAKPDHHVLLSLIETVTNGLSDLIAKKLPGESISFEEVMLTTGPFAFTIAVMEYLTAITGRNHNGDELDGIQEPVLIGDVLILPEKQFAALGEFTKENEAGRLVQHHFMGSWRAGHPG